VNGGATQLKGVAPDVVLPDVLELRKFREKDNAYALKWDEIEKADYKPWVNNSNMDAIIVSANAETAKNPSFQTIKKNVEWISKNTERPFSLNLKQYNLDKAQQKSVSKEIENAYKLAKNLNVNNIVADTMELNKTKEKIASNKLFVKRVSEDIYIDQSIKILNKMIANDILAKQN
jgi:carboxyl-terminal processing protease